LLFVFLTLTLLGIGIGGFLLFRHVGDIVRLQLERQLKEVFPNLEVKISAIRFWPGKAVELVDVSVNVLPESSQRASPIPLGRVGVIQLHSSRTLWESIRNGIEIQRVLLEDAEFFAVRDEGGEWNFRRIRCGLQGEGRVPEIIVKDSLLQVVGVGPWTKEPLTIRIHRASLYKGEPAQILAEATADGSATAFSLWSLSADCQVGGLGEATATVVVSSDIRHWSLQFKFHQIGLTPELWDQMPESLRMALPRVSILGGSLALDGKLNASEDSFEDSELELVGWLKDLRIALPQVSTPLTGISARFLARRNRIVIEELQGSWGAASVGVPRVELTQDSDGARLAAVVSIRNLQVNRELVALHPSFQQWAVTYGPEGMFDVEGNLVYQQNSWNWQIRVYPRKMTIVYSRLPYPVREVDGWLEWTDQHIWTDLHGKAGNSVISIQGRNLWREGAYQFVISSRGITLDPQMITALGTPAGERLAELNPSGDFSFRFVSTRQGKGSSPQRFLELGLLGCSVQYERFPYPIRNLRGRIRMWGSPAGEQWELEDAEGRNQSAQIFLRGRLENWSGRQFLQLQFWAKDLLLTEELRAALPSPTARSLWENLALRGSLREVSGQVLYDSTAGRVRVRFTADPAAGECSIQPVWFPYRLEALEGSLHYEDGQAYVSQLRGRHGAAKFSAAVEYTQHQDGLWQLELRDFLAEQLPLDQELIEAAPKGLREVLRLMNPSGRVNLRGRIGLRGSGDPAGRVQTVWALAVDTHQARLECGLKFSGVSGTAYLVGFSDDNRFACATQLDLTAASAFNVHCSQIRGPMLLDGKRILLGRSVPSNVFTDVCSWVGWDAAKIWAELGQDPALQAFFQQSAPTPVLFRVGSGLCSLDGLIQVEEESTFRLGFSLMRVDLTQLTQELLGRTENLRGTLYIQGEVRGKFGQPESLVGQGQIQLRDADVYELPLMIALLRILMIREPRRNAFSSADITFELEGKRILVPYVVFEGDALSFEGSGELDWEGRIRLVLRANLGRADGTLPLVRQLVGGASEQLVVLHVTGWVHDPLVSSEPFPMVNQILQQLQQEIRSGKESPPPRRMPHGFLPRLFPGLQ